MTVGHVMSPWPWSTAGTVPLDQCSLCYRIQMEGIQREGLTSTILQKIEIEMKSGMNALHANSSWRITKCLLSQSFMLQMVINLWFIMSKKRKKKNKQTERILGVRKWEPSRSETPFLFHYTDWDLLLSLLIFYKYMKTINYLQEGYELHWQKFILIRSYNKKCPDLR